jgi:hypothetical protein
MASKGSSAYYLGFDTRWAEASSGLLGVLWASWLRLTPGGIEGHVDYQAVAALDPGGFWMCFIAAASVTQIVAVVLDNLAARAVLCVAMGTVWLLLEEGLRAKAPWALSIPLYLGLAIQNVVPAFVLVTLLLRRERT